MRKSIETILIGKLTTLSYILKREGDYNAEYDAVTTISDNFFHEMRCTNETRGRNGEITALRKLYDCIVTRSHIIHGKWDIPVRRDVFIIYILEDARRNAP